MRLTRRQFASAAAATLATRSAVAAPDAWKVLQVAPLSGVHGGIGWHLRVGTQVAFDAANAAGAPFGRPLQLTTLDEANGPVSEQLRPLLRSGDVLALLNLHGRRSVAELAATGLPAEAGVPVLGVMCGSAAAPGFDAPWLFTVRGTWAHELDQVLAHAATVFARRVALLVPDDDDGREIEALARARASAAGVALVGVHRHLPDTAEVAAAVEAITRVQHDAVLLATNTAAVADFARLYAAAGGRARLVALSSAEATQLALVVGAAAARGVLISQVVPHPRDPKIRLMREFSAAYHRFGAADLPPTLAMTEGYIAARVLIDALQRTGPNATGAALQRTLAAMPRPLELAGLPVVLNAPRTRPGESARTAQPYRTLSAIGRDGQLLF